MNTYNALVKKMTRSSVLMRLLMVFCLSLSGLSLSAYANVSAKYSASCATCHQGGVLGAPKTGDTAKWAPRMKKGMKTLVANTKNGYKSMPARGLCDDCSDADYEALIKLMIKK